ncbi:MAG: DUF1501 domain-containing protein [Acidobacteria bacterium]|nr:DUF1501 domain-containing protein [Acidobacteriota bacterium]
MNTHNSRDTRRDFLRNASCAALSAAGLRAGLGKLGLLSLHASADPLAPTDFKALVCISLSGGCDGNNVVIPNDTTGYAAYASARSAASLAIPQAQLLSITPPRLGTAFGLNPGLAAIHPLFAGGQLAVACNVGTLVQPLTRAQYQSGGARPYQLFSHSDQVIQYQTARSDVKTQTGWGGLVADEVRSQNGGSAYPVVTSVAGTQVYGQGAITKPLAIAAAPTALNQVLVLSGFNASAESVARRAAMDQLRTQDRSAVLIASSSDAMQQALDISAAFATDPVLTTVFPTTGIGNQLKQVAKVIKLNQTAAQLSLNRMIFFAQLGGFDTHSNQITDQGNRLTELANALKAFYDATVELGVANRVTSFTLSDFGRTLQPSGSGGSVGSDHGWGNHQLVLGGAVRGGDFYGVNGPNGSPYPQLTLGGPNDTDSRGRWIPTASVDQYAATLATWFGVPAAQLGTVFPLLSRFSTPDLGFML